MSKTSKKFFCWIPTSLYVPFEKILRRLSQKGWMLISYSAFTLKFEKSSPCNRTYFIYHSAGQVSSEGKYSLSLRYHKLEKTFGAKKSTLNAYNKTYDGGRRILEVSSKKTADVGYKELLTDRNRLHFRELLRDSLLLLAFALFFSIIGSSLKFVFIFHIIAMLSAVNLLVGFFCYPIRGRVETTEKVGN